MPEEAGFTSAATMSKKTLGPKLIAMSSELEKKRSFIDNAKKRFIVENFIRLNAQNGMLAYDFVLENFPLFGLCREDMATTLAAMHYNGQVHIRDSNIYIDEANTLNS